MPRGQGHLMEVFQRIGLIKDKPKFKKWVSNKVPSKFPRSSGDGVSNPKFKKVKGTNSPNKTPTCGKCEKSSMAIALRGQIIDLVVERVVTRLSKLEESIQG